MDSNCEYLNGEDVEEDDSVRFKLTEWCILDIALRDFGLQGIPNKYIGEAVYNHFMDMMCLQGYIAKNEDE